MEQNSRGTSLLMSTNSVVFGNLHICAGWVFEIIKKKSPNLLRVRAVSMWQLRGGHSEHARPTQWDLIPFFSASGFQCISTRLIRSTCTLEWSRQPQAACSKLVFGWSPLGPAVRCSLARDRRAVKAQVQNIKDVYRTIYIFVSISHKPSFVTIEIQCLTVNISDRCYGKVEDRVQ